MDEILKDSRFAHIMKDPRFRRLPKKEKKVNIDKRFKSMFTDKKFKVKYTIDKRGRPAGNSSTEDLKRYYNLPSSSEDSDDDDDDGDDDESTQDEEKLQESEVEEEEQKMKRTKKGKKTKKSQEPVVDKDEGLASSESDSLVEPDDLSDDDNDRVDKRGLTETVKVKLHDLAVDYARGEGVLFSDSSSDEDSEDDSRASSDEIEHGWGELDRDADRTDEVTNRLAVCNMDWDRIRATDLMVLFNSFLPKAGIIHSVMIYPSDFGLERMKEEEVKGPIELCGKNSGDEGDEEDEEETEEGKKYHMEKLRQYQLNRLKYYYAVLVCDSPSTANHLYTDCDGLEYESSATRLDLRFVPDDVTFDHEPREVCDKMPDKYQPRYFTTTALQQAKVELTWDETDPGRAEITQKLMSGKVDEVDDADIQAYLALSSEGEEENEEQDNAKNGSGSEDETSSQADPISKYRALLQGIEEEEERKKSKDIEMEVTWGIGLKDKTEKLVQKKLKESAPSLTPFQQYLEKRKEKRKLKKEKKKKDTQQSGDDDSDDGEDNKAFSDDDIPSDIDMNDPYFKEEFEGIEKKSKKKKETRNKQGHKEELEEDKQKQAELDLLLMDDADERNHFSLKAIQDQESETKSKRRKKKKKKAQAGDEGVNEGADGFQVNVNDERFSAIFSSHLFNIDPADPHYRKTKGMEALRSEKLKRRQEEEGQTPPKQQRLANPKTSASEISMLVKKIKRRSEDFRK